MLKIHDFWTSPTGSIFAGRENLYRGAQLGSLSCTYIKFHRIRFSTFGDLRRKRDLPPNVDGRTDRRTDGRTDPNTIVPRSAHARGGGLTKDFSLRGKQTVFHLKHTRAHTYTHLLSTRYIIVFWHRGICAIHSPSRVHFSLKIYWS